jgi:hypothetical protein
MKSSMIAVGVAVALAGCSSVGDSNMFASKEKTVEYYRVFDIKTAAAGQEVVKAATDGINRNVNNATLDTPAGAEVQEQPGHFKMTDPASAPPGAAIARGPSCEGAAWTAKAAPKVRGGDNMNMVACLFPYKNGYHHDMYAVFTKPEGGWLSWPRRVGGMVLGTPDKFTETAMLDIVRSIRANTKAQVSLVEAKPNLPGTPWLEGGDAPLASTQAAPREASKP